MESPSESQPVNLKQEVKNLIEEFTVLEEESSKNTEEDKDLLLQKAEQLANNILSSLAIELLRQFTSSERLIASIKQYSESVKLKVRKADGVRRKRGFLTDKREVQLFLQNIINYIINEEFSSLKNLEISTGPSAI